MNFEEKIKILNITTPMKTLYNNIFNGGKQTWEKPPNMGNIHSCFQIEVAKWPNILIVFS
jgi:hypothetical protein